MKIKFVYVSLILIVTVVSLLFNGYQIPVLASETVVFASQPITEAKAGKLYTYQVNNRDSDDDYSDQEFDLIIAPEGMTIDKSTGLISWIPREEQEGTHEVNVSILNGCLKDEQQFSITVSLKQLSAISIKPVSMVVSTFSSESIESVTAQYTDGSSKVIGLVQCLFRSDNTNVAEVNSQGKISSKNMGKAIIIVSYTEKEITTSVALNVSVIIPTFQITGG